MLNVSVVGMGVGEKHAEVYENDPRCKLVSICDFNKNKKEYFKNKFPDTMIFNDVNHVLNDKQVDVISIASYDNYHCKQIVKAIENNKHVMAEKPICLNNNELLEIFNAQKNNKEVLLSSNLVLRANDRMKKFKDDISCSKFGEVFYVEGDYYWGRKEKLFGWRAEMDFYSIIMGAAIHMIDLIMWMFDSRPISVYVMGNNIGTKNTKLNFNSFAVILLKFENNLIAKLTGNGMCVHPHYHGLKIFGTKKTGIHNVSDAFYLNSSKPDIEKKIIKEPYPQKETRKIIINSFVDSIIDSRKSPIVTKKDVYDVMSVCFAAEESMKTNKLIEIDYLL